MKRFASFIITHYKQTELLAACIESIKKHINNLNYEIIVADSETQEETRELLNTRFPGVILSESKENIGFSKIVNRALKIARGNYIVTMNADIVLPDDSIEKIFSYLEEHKDVGLVGPALFYPDGNPQPSGFRFYSPFTLFARRTFLGKIWPGKQDLNRFLMNDVDLTKKPIPVDWLMGSAVFAKKEALENVGPMDERFFMYLEDVDWSRRFWEKGYCVIYYPFARLVHHHIKASKKSGGFLDLVFNKYTRIHLTSALKYFLKYGLKTPRYGS